MTKVFAVMRIPKEVVHPFRSKWPTCSDSSGAAVPEEVATLGRQRIR